MHLMELKVHMLKYVTTMSYVRRGYIEFKCLRSLDFLRKGPKYQLIVDYDESRMHITVS